MDRISKLSMLNRDLELYAPADSPRYDREPDWQLEQLTARPWPCLPVIVPRRPHPWALGYDTRRTVICSGMFLTLELGSGALDERG
jgi:hypothetical protein